MLSVIGQLVNQKIAPGLDVGFRSKLIRHFYETDRQYKHDLAAVRQNGLALLNVKHQTEEICLAAVKQNGFCLKYVKHQTPEICLAAVQQNGYALEFMKHQTVEICRAAVEQDYGAMTYCQSRKGLDL